MNVEKFKERLKRYKREDIVFSSHTEIRALHRNIDLDEVVCNVLNPEKLVAVVYDENKSRYGCYFAYSKTYCYKYVLVLKHKVIIVTIISINRNWQRMLK